MKIAFLSESSADEAAVRILAGGILQQPVDPVEFPLRHHDWPAVQIVLPAVIRHLHFRTEAEGLVVVVDANGSEVHARSHDQANPAPPDCRLCGLRQLADETKINLPRRTHGTEVNVAIGLAVPAIEAWYLYGNPVRAASEALWLQGVASRALPYTKARLKEWVYGTSRPSLTLETEKAREAAHRIAASHIEGLSEHFPGGFSPLAEALRGWTRTQS